MTASGITDGATMHPIHLWPKKFSRPKIVRKQFECGRQFTNSQGIPVTVFDLPPKIRIVLHCSTVSRLILSIPEQ